MKRTAPVVALVVVGLVVASLSAAAEPSLLGFTGLLATPTAETLGDGDYNFGINTTNLDDLDDFSYYANFGLADGLEVGVLLWRPDSEPVSTASFRSGGNETFIQLKKSLVVEGMGNPDVAVGVFDVTDEVETTVYGVATWEQGRSVGTVEGRDVRFLNLHAGFSAGQLQDAFVGAELLFGPRVGILGEWIDGEVNVGARFRPVPDINVDLGLLDGDDFAGNVSYNKSF